MKKLKQSKKLRKIGGSYAMLLPNSFIKLLDINENIDIEISIDFENESIALKQKEEK